MKLTPAKWRRFAKLPLKRRPSSSPPRSTLRDFRRALAVKLATACFVSDELAVRLGRAARLFADTRRVAAREVHIADFVRHVRVWRNEAHDWCLHLLRSIGRP